MGAGADIQILLVVDGAGWHRSKDLVVPEGIHLEILPPYSPELQPAERLWRLADEPLANRAFEQLEQLEEILEVRCRTLADSMKPENEVLFMDGTVFIDVVVKKAAQSWLGSGAECFIIFMVEE